MSLYEQLTKAPVASTLAGDVLGDEALLGQLGAESLQEESDYRDVEVAEVVSEQALVGVEQLEMLQAAVEVGGESFDARTGALIGIQLEAISKSNFLGLEAADETTEVFGMENFGGASQAEEATGLGKEAVMKSVKEAAGKAKTAVINFFKKIYNWLKNLLGTNKTQVERVKKFEKALAAAKSDGKVVKKDAKVKPSSSLAWEKSIEVGKIITGLGASETIVGDILEKSGKAAQEGAKTIDSLSSLKGDSLKAAVDKIKLDVKGGKIVGGKEVKVEEGVLSVVSTGESVSGDSTTAPATFEQMSDLAAIAKDGFDSLARRKNLIGSYANLIKSMEKQAKFDAEGDDQKDQEKAISAASARLQKVVGKGVSFAVKAGGTYSKAAIALAESSLAQYEEKK